MKIEEFKSVTDRAFSFLASEYHYRFGDAKRGGYFGTAFVRVFNKNNLKITLVVGDADSENFCDVYFTDGVESKVDQDICMERSLAVLLKQRYPEFKHPSVRDVLTPESRVKALYVYGDLVEKYASDVVVGDFSAFPGLMLALHHLDKTSGIYRFIGVYSSIERVNRAISERKSKHGFRLSPEGFEVTRIEVDGVGAWYAGIPVDDELKI